MPWLKLTPGRDETITILPAAATRQAVHWQDNRSVICLGEKCPIDHSKNAPHIKYQLQIFHDGREKTWEFSHLVWDQLLRIAGEPAALRGLVITLRKVGSGANSRIVVLPSGQAKREQVLPNPALPPGGVTQDTMASPARDTAPIVGALTHADLDILAQLLAPRLAEALAQETHFRIIIREALRADEDSAGPSQPRADDLIY